jgi:hypothetical protein
MFNLVDFACSVFGEDIHQLTTQIIGEKPCHPNQRLQGK